MSANHERAKRIVASWPQWKRNVTLTKYSEFGGTMFFVMLHHPSESVPAIPLVDDNGEMCFFTSHGDACEKGESSELGEEYGFEVFKLGYSF